MIIVTRNPRRPLPPDRRSQLPLVVVVLAVVVGVLVFLAGFHVGRWRPRVEEPIQVVENVRARKDAIRESSSMQ